MRLDRARAWCQVLAIAAVVFTGLRWGLIAWGIPFLGDPRDLDFASFYAAAQLAYQGHPDWAYDQARHAVVQNALPGNAGGYAAFFYPPGFLLICLPLVLFGYFPAVATWLATTGLAWLLVARRYLPRQAAYLGLLAFPAAWNNIWHGQNAFLSTALLGAAGLALDKRPFVAGVCLGFLSYKPHLNLLMVPALLASRCWMALVGLVAGALLLQGASWLAFGTPTWVAFLVDLPLARQAMELALIGDAKLSSIFAALRLLGASLAFSYAIQTIATLLLLGTVMLLAWRRPNGMALAALIAAATPLTSPFILDYDFVLLSLPIGWVLRMAERDGRFLPWERIMLGVVFLGSGLTRLIAVQTGIALAPLILIAFFLLLIRRVRSAPRHAEAGAPSAPSGASP